MNLSPKFLNNHLRVDINLKGSVTGTRFANTGAIGSAAVQLLKHFGAQVTAVCQSKHFEMVRGLGADQVWDYTQEDFTRRDEKFDFVFDAVGKSSFRKSKAVLKEKGVY
ncbi:MAG TPA: zinc-binding dehydrogenase, partial [Leptospiraceae bacterium]|nr:zinc-binding dehydrogenase [Leptospiraceae bacterium]